MSTITQAAFAPASLRILEISYHCDLTQVGGRVIPLGVLVDLRVAGLYGLGLVARQTLTEEEACHVGALIRPRIATPFAYLSSIYDEVFDASSPGSVFETLPDRHNLSLAFTLAGAARAVSLPLPAKRSVAARRSWAIDELQSAGNEAYWHMFGEGDPVEVEKAVKEQTRAEAA